MKKFKLISSTGRQQFEADLNEWIEANQDVDIISVSHSCYTMTLPAGAGQTAFSLNFSALITYQEQENRKPRKAEFGWEKDI